MSSTTASRERETDLSLDDLDAERYTEGEERYVHFAEDFLGIRLAETQERLLRALASHQRVVIQSGNGVGKSFGAGIGNLGFTLTNVDSTAMSTSGTYTVLNDVLWKPMRSMFKAAQSRYHLPGRTLENPPRLFVDDDWFWKAVSPTHPDNLEGRHDGTMLVTIEEVDKPDVTAEHIDSAGSSITDANDRFLAICNPPRDEANIAHTLVNEDDRWHTIRFSSFESHNVRVDAGLLDEQHIPGLVDLPTVAEDWEAWNDEDWPETPDAWPGVATLRERVHDGDLPRSELVKQLRPGVDVARRSAERDDLDERWYRRRLGVVPPAGVESHRPFHVREVRSARIDSDAPDLSPPCVAIGVDVARAGGDATAIAYLWPNGTITSEHFTVGDHNENERLIRKAFDGKRGSDTDIAIDAVGEGSALADRLVSEVPNCYRFQGGMDPDDTSTDPDETAPVDEYYNTRAWAHDLLGQHLRSVDGGPNGGGIYGKRLRKELFAAAREYEYEEKTLRGGTVLQLSDKDDLADRLGRSPDVLDAATMALWASAHVPATRVPSTWRD